MRKKIILLILCLLLPVLGGCATDNAIPDLSEKEMQMVEEYAARLLLEYHKGYRPTTVTDDELLSERERIERQAQVQQQIASENAARAAAKEEKKKDEAREGGDGGDGGEGSARETSGPVYTDIDEFFGLSGFNIEFSRFLVCENYPETTENDWQGVVKATAGNRLLVSEFNISNTGGEDAVLDIGACNPRFTFRINNSFSKAAMMTMLLNDLALYRGTVPAGETVTGVLVIELTQAQAESVDSLTMIMRSADDRGELTLK
ncbi:MAG: hypothetical protein IK115_11765 [Lachnospiraceae bacterium]|nr:hypothetical protein [Lachnospiraceae bacterium]